MFLSNCGAFLFFRFLPSTHTTKTRWNFGWTVNINAEINAGQANMGLLAGCCFKNESRSKGNKHKQVEHSAKISKSRKNVFKLTTVSPDVAATKIQSAYRAYRARKGLRRLKGIARFRGVIEERHSVKNQTTSALNHIHFWSRVQAEIKARWLGMVVDSRTRQKKLDNQQKLDAKLHDLEVEWSGGPETTEEIVNRIQQREAAAAKRERAMAYAFSHQWRASTNQYFGQSYYDLSKESWGWSWKERWVAVRPWENRYQTRPSLVKQVETEHNNKITSEAPHLVASTKTVKSVPSNGKLPTHPRKTSRVSQVATQ